MSRPEKKKEKEAAAKEKEITQLKLQDLLQEFRNTEKEQANSKKLRRTGTS